MGPVPEPIIETVLGVDPVLLLHLFVPIRAHDDQGVAVPLHPAGFRAAAWWAIRGAARGARDEARRGTILYGLRTLRRHAGRLLLFGGLVTLASLTVMLTILEGPTGAWLIIFSPVAMTWVSIGLGVLASVAVAWQALKATMADAMLGQRRCPACAYSIAALPPDPAQNVRCPECGASWLAARLGRDRPMERRVIILDPVPPG